MEPDYHTVMENKIRYYSLKYDPENKWGRKEKRFEKPEKDVKQQDTVKKPGKRLRKSFEKAISVFI
jgi:hypothetical protein